MKKTKCKYCGKVIEGTPVVEKETGYKICKGVLHSCIAGLNAMAGNIYGTITSKKASENILDTELKIVSDVRGGAMYHFDCPYCHQSFDKVIY